MFSNLITEMLAKIDTFDFKFSDAKAYSKVEKIRTNQISYISQLIANHQKISINLKYIEFNEILQNPNILKYRYELLENKKDVDLQTAYDFLPVVQKVLEKHKDDYFDKIIIDDKKILDFTYDEAVAKLEYIISELDKQILLLEQELPSFVNDFLAYNEISEKNIINNKLFMSKTLNLALGDFPILFIRKIIQTLIENNNLECLLNIFDYAIDTEERNTFIQTINLLKEQIFYDENFKFCFENIEKELFDNAIENFIELFSDKNLTNENSIFLHIGNYIQINKTLLDEFTEHFYEKFGNILTLPLADILRNAIINSDKELEIYCKINEINLNEFLIDIRSRINSDYYQKFNYATAIELDKKLNKGE